MTLNQEPPPRWRRIIVSSVDLGWTKRRGVSPTDKLPGHTTVTLRMEWLVMRDCGKMGGKENKTRSWLVLRRGWEI